MFCLLLRHILQPKQPRRERARHGSYLAAAHAVIEHELQILPHGFLPRRVRRIAAVGGQNGMRRTELPDRIQIAFSIADPLPVLQRLARFYIWVIRGTPVLVQLFVVFYGLPGVGILIEPFPAAVLVFSINEGAYCAETIRAALESVPAGQMEAGYCVGMTYLQTMRRIVLPQALRTAFPPLFNSLISLLKDTSLAANITVTEMFMATQRIVARTYESLPLYLEVAFIYLMFSTILTQVQRWGEKKLNAKGFSQNS